MRNSVGRKESLDGPIDLVPDSSSTNGGSPGSESFQNVAALSANARVSKDNSALTAMVTEAAGSSPGHAESVPAQTAGRFGVPAKLRAKKAATKPPPEPSNGAQADNDPSMFGGLQASLPTAVTGGENAVESSSAHDSVDNSQEPVVQAVASFEWEDKPLVAAKGSYDLSSFENAEFAAPPGAVVRSVKPTAGKVAPKPGQTKAPPPELPPTAPDGSSSAPSEPSGPFSERWASKAVSARRSAVAELTAKFKDGSPTLAPEYASALDLSSLSGLLDDKAQLIAEAAVLLADAVVSSPVKAARYASFLTDESAAGLLVKSLCAKALGSPKTPIGDAAVDAIAGIVAVCSTGIACAADELIAALKTMSKPKVARNAARTWTRIIAAGRLTSAVKHEAMVPALPQLILSNDKALSAAGMELTKAVAGVRGPFSKAVRGMVEEYSKTNGLTPEQVAEITAACDSASSGEDAAGGAAGPHPGTPKSNLSDPLEAEWAELEHSAAWIAKDGPPKNASKEVAALHLDDKLSPNAEDKVTKAKLKWNDRAKAIDDMLQLLAKHPRLSGECSGSSGYGDAVSGLRKGLKDTNAAVVAKSINGLQALSCRLRAGFSGAAKSCLGDIVARLREKRGQPSLAAVAALRTFVRFESISVEELLTGSVMPGEDAWKKAPLDFRKNMLQLAVTILHPSGTGLPKGHGLTGARLKAVLTIINAGLADANPEVKMEAERVLAIAMLRAEGSAEVAAVLDGYEKDSKAGGERTRAMAEGKVPIQTVADADAAKAASAALSTTANASSSSASAAAPSAEGARPPGPPGATIKRRPGTAAATLRATSRPAPGVTRPGTAPGAVGAAKPAGASSGSAGGSSEAGELAYQASIAEEPGSLPSVEEATDTLINAGLQGFGAAEAGLLDKPGWADRKQGIESLVAGVTASPRGLAFIEAVVAFLAGKTQGWKPSGGLNNAVLLVSTASALVRLAGACTLPTHFTRRAARNVLDGLLPYMKEKKGSEEVGRLASSLAVAVGPNLVASRLVAVASAEKAGPVLMTAVNERLCTLIETHGVGRLSGMHLLPHLASTAGVQAADVKIKNTAMRALMALYAQIGPPLSKAVLANARPGERDKAAPTNKWGINDNLVKTLEAEFEKAAYTPEKARAILAATKPVLGEVAPPPVRLHGEAVVAGAPTTEAVSEWAGERADVLALLQANNITDMDTPDVPKQGSAGPSTAPAAPGKTDDGTKPWQVRMNAVDAVLAALTKAGADAPGAAVLVNDNSMKMLQALKRRLADVQANVKPRACQAIAALAKAAGPGIAASACKTVVPTLLEMLGDKKAGLKDAAVAALDAIVQDHAAPAGPAGPAVHAPSLVVVFNVCASSGVLGVMSGGSGGAMGGTLGGGLGATVSASDKGGTGVGIVGGIRETLVPWIAKYAPMVPKSTPGATSMATGLVPATLDCVGDRLPGVRKAATDLLCHLARLAGSQPLVSGLSYMKEASRLGAQEAVERAVAVGKAMADREKDGLPLTDEDAAGGKAAVASASSSAAAGGSSSSASAAPPRPGQKSAVPVGASRSTSQLRGTSAAPKPAPVDPTASYAIAATAPSGKAIRAAVFDKSLLKQWDAATRAGSDIKNSDVKSVETTVNAEVTKAGLLSDKLSAQLNKVNDPKANQQAVEWMAGRVAAVVESRDEREMVGLRDGSDLLLKIAAVLTMLSPVRASFTATAKLTDAVLSLYEQHMALVPVQKVAGPQHPWAFTKYEGDIIVPVLMERAEHMTEAVGLMARAITLLRTNIEYQPRGINMKEVDPYAAVVEHYYSARIPKLADRPINSVLALVPVVTCLVSQRGSDGVFTVRRELACVVAKRYEDPFFNKSPQLRSYLTDLFGELYVAHGRSMGPIYGLLGFNHDGTVAPGTAKTPAISKKSMDDITKAAKAYAEKKQKDMVAAALKAAQSGKGAAAVVQATAGAARQLASGGAGLAGTTEDLSASQHKRLVADVDKTLADIGAGLGSASYTPKGKGPSSKLTSGMISSPELMAGLGLGKKAPVESDTPDMPKAMQDVQIPGTMVKLSKPGQLTRLGAAPPAVPAATARPQLQSAAVQSAASGIQGPISMATSASSTSSAPTPLASTTARTARQARSDGEPVHLFLGGFNRSQVNHEPDVPGSDAAGSVAATVLGVAKGLYTAVRQSYSDSAVTAATEAMRVLGKAVFTQGSTSFDFYEHGVNVKRNCEDDLVAVCEPLMEAVTLAMRGIAAWSNREDPTWCMTTGEFSMAQTEFTAALLALMRGILSEECVVVQLNEDQVAAGFKALLSWMHCKPIKVLMQNRAKEPISSDSAVFHHMDGMCRRLAFRARRDHVANITLKLVHGTAAWMDNGSGDEKSARPPLMGRSAESGSEALAFVHSYERSESGSNRFLGATFSASQRMVKHKDFVSVVQGYVDALNHPVISYRARKIMAALAEGPEPTLDTRYPAKGVVSKADMNVPVGLGGHDKLRKLPAQFEVTADDPNGQVTKSNAIQRAVTGLLASFAGMVAVHGLMLDEVLAAAGCDARSLPANPVVLLTRDVTAQEYAALDMTADDEAGSFARVLYHFFLSSMANMTRVSNLVALPFDAESIDMCLKGLIKGLGVAGMRSAPQLLPWDKSGIAKAVAGIDGPRVSQVIKGLVDIKNAAEGGAGTGTAKKGQGGRRVEATPGPRCALNSTSSSFSSTGSLNSTVGRGGVFGFTATAAKACMAPIHEHTEDGEDGHGVAKKMEFNSRPSPVAAAAGAAGGATGRKGGRVLPASPSNESLGRTPEASPTGPAAPMLPAPIVARTGVKAAGPAPSMLPGAPASMFSPSRPGQGGTSRIPGPMASTARRTPNKAVVPPPLPEITPARPGAMRSAGDAGPMSMDDLEGGKGAAVRAAPGQAQATLLFSASRIRPPTSGGHKATTSIGQPSFTGTTVGLGSSRALGSTQVGGADVTADILAKIKATCDLNRPCAMRNYSCSDPGVCAGYAPRDVGAQIDALFADYMAGKATAEATVVAVAELGLKCCTLLSDSVRAKLAGLSELQLPDFALLCPFTAYVLCKMGLEGVLAKGPDGQLLPAPEKLSLRSTLVGRYKVAVLPGVADSKAALRNLPLTWMMDVVSARWVTVRIAPGSTIKHRLGDSQIPTGRTVARPAPGSTMRPGLGLGATIVPPTPGTAALGTAPRTVASAGVGPNRRRTSGRVPGAGPAPAMVVAAANAAAAAAAAATPAAPAGEE